MSGLAKRLVVDGLLQEEQAAEAQEKALKSREPFVSYLVENKLVASSAIAASACHEFGVPLFDLSSMELEAAPVALVDEKLIRQHHTLPLFHRGNRFRKQASALDTNIHDQLLSFFCPAAIGYARPGKVDHGIDGNRVRKMNIARQWRPVKGLLLGVTSQHAVDRMSICLQ